MTTIIGQICYLLAYSRLMLMTSLKLKNFSTNAFDVCMYHNAIAVNNLSWYRIATYPAYGQDTALHCTIAVARLSTYVVHRALSGNNYIQPGDISHHKRLYKMVKLLHYKSKYISSSFFLSFFLGGGKHTIFNILFCT